MDDGRVQYDVAIDITCLDGIYNTTRYKTIPRNMTDRTLHCITCQHKIISYAVTLYTIQHKNWTYHYIEVIWYGIQWGGLDDIPWISKFFQPFQTFHPFQPSEFDTRPCIALWELKLFHVKFPARHGFGPCFSLIMADIPEVRNQIWPTRLILQSIGQTVMWNRRQSRNATTNINTVGSDGGFWIRCIRYGWNQVPSFGVRFCVTIYNAMMQNHTMWQNDMMYECTMWESIVVS